VHSNNLKIVITRGLPLVAIVAVVGVLLLRQPIYSPSRVAPPDGSQTLTKEESDQKIAALSARAAAAERDVSSLRAAIEDSKKAGSSGSAITFETLGAMVRSSVSRWNQGAKDEALAELKWAYEAAGRVRGSDNIRLGIVFHLERFARNDTRAADLLRTLRIGILEEMKGNNRNYSLASYLDRLNTALGEKDATLQLFDSLPDEHFHKLRLKGLLFDSFVAKKRYQEAIEVKSLAEMINDVYYYIELRESPSKMQSSTALMSVRSDIDVLVANGRYDEASFIMKRFVEKEGSGASLVAMKAYFGETSKASNLIDAAVGQVK
jgi:hypothetical protein